MRNKRSRKNKGISVSELLERELSAENNETNDTDDIREDTSSDVYSADTDDISDNYEDNIEELSAEEDFDEGFDENIDIEPLEDDNDDKPLENAPTGKTEHKKNLKNSKNKNRRSKGKIGNVVLIAACIFVVLCFAAYMLIAFGYYRNRFLQGTVLNGNDVSNITTRELEDELNGNVEKYALTVMDNDSVLDVINGADIKLTISEEGKNAIDNACSAQNKIMWPMGLLGTGCELTVDSIASFDEAALTSAVENSKGYNLPQTIMGEPATLKYKNGKYEVTPPTSGNEIDKDAYMTRIKEYASELKDTMVIQDADVYVKTAESEIKNEQTLITACDKANEIIKDTSISVKMGDSNEDITADIMNGILSIDDNGVTLDSNTINAYIANLNKKYNNIGMTRTFKTGHGTEVRVKGGDYGCTINTKNLAADIQNAIFNKKPLDTTIKFTRNVLNGTGAEIGKSYIEVDLTNQYLYMFIDGKKVKECPVVTGLPGAKATPQGVYMLKNKMMDVPLVGDNYVTPVKYWMPFNGGIGLHDAVWQSRFGGELYKSKGSHGCVNLMMKDAADIYKNAIVKMPVICYYHNRISSFQPIASSGPVQGTYRALTAKERKMLSDLLNGKKVNDSSAVRDSNEDRSAADSSQTANNTDANTENTADAKTDDVSSDQSGANVNDNVEKPNTADVAAEGGNESANTDSSADTALNGTDNVNTVPDKTNDAAGTADVDDIPPESTNSGSADQSGNNAGSSDVIQEIVVTPEAEE